LTLKQRIYGTHNAYNDTQTGRRTNILLRLIVALFI